MEPIEYYVSVASMFYRFFDLSTKQQFAVGMRNKGADKVGKKLYTAIAGGMQVKPPGEIYLKQKFNARFKEQRNAEGLDLRFYVGENYLERVLKELETPNPELFETPDECVIRDIGEELYTVEMPHLQPVPILTECEFDGLALDYIGFYRQPAPADGKGSSANVTDSPPRRLFHLFNVFARHGVMEKLRASPICEFFSEEELALTDGGRKKAIVRGEITLGDNMFVLPDVK